MRDWIHVEDHCEAIRVVLEQGVAGAVYNISACDERTNREVCDRILAVFAKPESLVRYVEDRPGHDRRYALDATRIRTELDWSPRISFEDGLTSTLDWYRDNRPWWERVKSGEYRGYYDRLYGRRLAEARPDVEAADEGGSDD